MMPLCKLPKSLRSGGCPGMRTGLQVGDGNGRGAGRGLSSGRREQSRMGVLEIGICLSWHLMAIPGSSTQRLRVLLLV